MTFIDLNKITHDLVQGLGPVESKKLFMFVEPNRVPAFPKGREDNTHLNIYGARTVAGLAVKAIGKEIPELAKCIRHYDYVVAQDGSGDFFTVQEAVNAVPDFRKNVRTTILVRKGTYKEKIIIPESKINISLIGEDGTILTNDDFANKKNVFGENMGTSGSSSCYIYAPDFMPRISPSRTLQVPWGKQLPVLFLPTVPILRTVVFSASRIHSTHTASKAANIMRTATSKARSILFSVGLRLSSIVAAFTARGMATSLLLLPIKERSTVTFSTTVG